MASHHPESRLDVLKRLIVSPRHDHADSNDFEDKLRGLDISEEDVREGLAFAVFELWRQLRRLKRELQRAAIQTEESADTVAEQRRAAMTADWNTQLNGIVALVQARWTAERRLGMPLT